MISDTNISPVQTVGFYDEYRLTDAELFLFTEMIENDEGEAALDLFIKENILPPGTKYSDVMRQYLNDAESGILRVKDKNKIIRSVALLSTGLSLLWNRSFRKYLTNVYSPIMFRNAGITSADTKRIILTESIGIFNQAINGTMSQTSSFINNGIRTFQREMIVENLKIKSLGLIGQSLSDEIIRFKNDLISKYPQLYKAMNEGNILVTSKFGLDGVTFRHYKIETYIDMAIRTTLLNADRTSNLTMVIANNESVVEYILADPRSVKKDRVICQDILNNLVFGKSLLALNKETASKLNIMTIEEAESTPDYAMGVDCRHTIRRVNENFLQKINKLIEE